MELFASLAVAARSFGEGEDGQTLVHEVLAMALLVFAVFGVITLLGRLH